jgi:hypothetical protein
MTIAQPSSAISRTPVPDKWLVLPYEGPEISGKMIWAPSRSQPEDVSVPLPALGRCRIHLGIYSSGTVPIWFNLFVAKGQWDPTRWHRVQVRLSDENYHEVLHPVNFPQEPRFTHICERYWKTADLRGQSLVLRGRRKDAHVDAMSFLAFIRLEPVAGEESRSPRDRQPWAYLDGNFLAHNVTDEQDVRDILLPLRDNGVKLAFWTTSREDTCYYNSRVGNVLPDTGVPGNYPFYAGRDIQQMIASGHDPLKIACKVAHDAGMQIFGSYRRMTYRMPPFVYPLHPDALMARRRDLWCADEHGRPLPHLSLAYPEVRERMLAIQQEQLNDYDIDGLHLFFARGVPFVGCEQPFIDAFARRHAAVDPRKLPLEDERAWDVRGEFILAYLRELRQAANDAARARGRPLRIALHVMHCVRICRYYGLDIPAIARERLVDIIIPAVSPFLPREMADWPEVRHGVTAVSQIQTSGIMATSKPEHLEEFQQLVGASGMEIFPHESSRSPYGLRESSDSRLVRVTSMDGMTLDSVHGLPTCG